MIGTLVRVVALTGVYLLALTSVTPGDVLVGLVLAVALVAFGARHRRRRPAERAGSSTARLAGVPALVGGTLVDMVRGSWSVVLYCLGLRRTSPGLVTVPIGPCRPAVAAAWGVRVGIAPDSVVVDLDEERGTMLLHVLDASDPDAVLADQQDLYRRRQRRVFG